MNAKQHLFQLRTLKSNIEKCEAGIEDIEMQMQGMHSVRYDTVRVQTSHEDNKAALLDKLKLVENKLIEYKARYWLMVIKTQAEILTMPNETHRMILSEYFLNNKTIKKIAYEHDYDEKYIYNQYYVALKEFSKIFKDVVEKW